MPSSSRLFLFLAAAVLLSLAWHCFDFDHGHPAVFGNPDEAVFHAAGLNGLFLLALVFALSPERLLKKPALFPSSVLPDRQRDPLAAFLAGGVLHPKIYG